MPRHPKANLVENMSSSLANFQLQPNAGCQEPDDHPFNGELSGRVGWGPLCRDISQLGMSFS